MQWQNIYYKTTNKSPIGVLTLACDNKENLIGLWIEGQKYFGDLIKNKSVEDNKIEIFNETKEWLDRYFNKEKPSISELSLKPVGSEFRQAVWKELCKIPYGETKTYSDIAQEIAKQKGIKIMSAQAVGTAIAHNPISIIIPCHRVIGKNGSLTGYSGGIKIKEKLLQIEDIKI